MKAWWVCTALFAIVFVAIRLACANYPLFWDEWISIFFTRLPTGKLWSDWMVHESNPPLYYTLLKTWLNAFGSTPFSARMLSVAGGLLAAVVLSLCSHRVFGFWGALTTYAICAFSSQDVFYSLFIRSYILVLLAFAVSLLGLLILLGQGASPKQRNRGLMLYAAGAVAAVYLHTTMLLWPVVASLAVCALAVVDRRERRLLPGWIAAHSAPAQTEQRTVRFAIAEPVKAPAAVPAPRAARQTAPVATGRMAQAEKPVPLREDSRRAAELASRAGRNEDMRVHQQRIPARLTRAERRPYQDDVFATAFGNAEQEIRLPEPAYGRDPQPYGQASAELPPLELSASQIHSEPSGTSDAAAPPAPPATAASSDEAQPTS